MKVFSVIAAILFSTQLIAQLPEDFSDQLVADDWQSVVGIAFDDNGRMYSWAKHGVVNIADDGVLLSQPLLDISEEVSNWGDHGLLGFALHPNFLTNGYYYVMYAVDRHHLLYFGTPEYDPGQSVTHQPSIGRVVRYTADVATNFTTTVEGSRKVLIGETISTGIPLLHVSHGVGSLVFGKDGTLLLTVGDGGSYAGTDIGNESASAYDALAIQDGIITADQDVGAFRSQQVNSLSGKVLRIDANTGDGIPSNPFYDPANPRAPQSRVWTLGLRNPYRLSVQPGTGSHYPEDGDPGVLWIGDVGWAYWEEFNRVDRGGVNLGWPIYEGLRTRWQYHGRPLYNPQAPNPLDGGGGCVQQYFYFQDLLAEDQQNGTPFFPNPCNGSMDIPNEIPTFTHQRPVIAWSNVEWNTEEQDTHVPGYDSFGSAIIHSLNDLDCPVDGTFFNGKCAVGGEWISDNNWPEEFQNKYYGADYTGWFKSLEMDHNGTLLSVSDFFEGGENIVDLALNPVDGCLYYVEYAYLAEVRKICYGGNPRPTAVIGSDEVYGASPLEIHFTGMASTDPDNDPLTYSWDFGDNSSSEEIEPIHTFTSSTGKPQPFLVSLTVTDTAGNSHTDYLTISLNNTPPSVEISSIDETIPYSMNGVTEIPLTATVTDAEQDAEELEYAWQVFLHHNTHNHPEAIDTERESVTYLFPEGCGDEEFWYRVGLTVRDNGGLEAYDEKELFPFCGGAKTEFGELEATPGEKVVEISWTTLNEVPGSLFIVEKSKDKAKFEFAGTANASGAGTAYAITDQTPINGVMYYRIQTVTPDGFRDYSPLAEVVFPGVDGVRLQPIPFQNQLSIEFEEIEESAEFAIYSLDGRVLHRFSWQESGQRIVHDIRVSTLPAGIYLYEANDGRSRYYGKLIKRD